MSKKMYRKQEVADKLNLGEVDEYPIGEIDHSVWKRNGYNWLGGRIGVTAAYYNPKKNIMVTNTEGDYHIYRNPSKKKISKLLSYYKKGHITGTGEKYDERFDRETEEKEGFDGFF